MLFLFYPLTFPVYICVLNCLNFIFSLKLLITFPYQVFVKLKIGFSGSKQNVKEDDLIGEKVWRDQDRLLPGVKIEQ